MRAISGSAIRAWVIPVGLVSFVFLCFPLALAFPPLAILLIGVLGLFATFAALGSVRMMQIMLVLAMFTGPWQAVTMPGASAVTLSDLFLIIALGAAIPTLMDREQMSPPNSFIVGSWAFIVIGLLTTMVHENPVDGIWYFARVVINNIIIPLMFFWIAPRGRFLVALPMAYMAGTTVSALAGAFTGYIWRSHGLAEHSNALGFTGMLSVAFVPFLWRCTTAWGRFWVVVFTVGALFGVWTSGSRSSLVGVFAVVALIPLLERSIVAAVFVGGAGVVLANVVGQVAVKGSSDAVSRLFAPGGDAVSSDEKRTEGLIATLERIADSPLLGIGYLQEVRQAHDLWLQILVASGVFGFIAFLAIMWTFLAPLHGPKGIGRLLCYPTLAFAIGGTFQPSMTNRFVGLPLAMALVGVGILLERAARTRSDEDEEDDFLAEVRPPNYVRPAPQVF